METSGNYPKYSISVDLQSYFDPNNPSPSWENFSSIPESMKGSISSKSIDFSISHKPQKVTLKKVMAIALKIVFFPIGLMELGRHVIFRIGLSIFYPAQSQHIKFVLKKLGTDELSPLGSDKERVNILEGYSTTPHPRLQNTSFISKKERCLAG